LPTCSGDFMKVQCHAVVSV